MEPKKYYGAYIWKIGILSFIVFGIRFASIFVSAAIILVLLELATGIKGGDITMYVALAFAAVIAFARVYALILGLLAETGNVARFPELMTALAVNLLLNVGIYTAIELQTNEPFERMVAIAIGMICFEIALYISYVVATKKLPKVGVSDVTRVSE